MIPNPQQCCFYKIQEGAKNEYVSIGSNGNILRWADTGGPEQEWLIVPVDGAKCKIQSRQNGEFIAVGSDGNIRRWKDTGGPEQHFSFVNHDQGWWNIQENTRNEFVAVGSNGNILRWKQTRNKEQNFRLVPVNPTDKPKLEAAACEPGAIGDIPRIGGFGEIPPERSSPKLIGETLVPAVFVTGDAAYSDRLQQVSKNAYYILRREQYWDRSGERGDYYEHDGYREFIKGATVKFGFSESSAKSVEETLALKVSASGEFSFSAAAASISSEISRELKVRTSQETTITSERSETFQVTFPKERFVYALWSMVDHYQLLNMKRKLVREWEIVLEGTSIADAYPRKLPMLVEKK